MSTDRPRHPKGFTVAHLNARSLKHKVDEICILLDRHNLDILSISETWLHPAVEDICLKIPGFSSYRYDRCTDGSPPKGEVDS